MTSSNYMLVAITLDRHRAITRPLSKSRSSYHLVTGAWLASLFPSLPSIGIFKEELRPSQLGSFLQPECVSDFTGWPSILRKTYFIGVASLIFAIPLLLFICLYVHVVWELCKAVSSFKERVRHFTFYPK